MGRTDRDTRIYFGFIQRSRDSSHIAALWRKKCAFQGPEVRGFGWPTESIRQDMASLVPEVLLTTQKRAQHIPGVRGRNNMCGENPYEIIAQIAERGLVASHAILHSIHDKDNFRGVPPTAKPIDIGAITLERTQNGKTVGHGI